MTRIFFTALITASAMTMLSERAARAAEPPWCLISGFGGERYSYGSPDACLREGPGAATSPTRTRATTAGSRRVGVGSGLRCRRLGRPAGAAAVNELFRTEKYVSL
jgi:hypothetical protein